MPTRLLHPPPVPDTELHRPVEAMTVDQLVRNRSTATANTLVGLLQCDDVGVDFLQHAQHAARVAAPVEADRPAHVVAGDGDGGTGHLSANPPAARAFLKRRGCDGQHSLYSRRGSTQSPINGGNRRRIAGIDSEERAIGGSAVSQLLGVISRGPLYRGCSGLASGEHRLHQFARRLITKPCLVSASGCASCGRRRVGFAPSPS